MHLLCGLGAMLGSLSPSEGAFATAMVGSAPTAPVAIAYPTERSTGAAARLGSTPGSASPQGAATGKNEREASRGPGAGALLVLLLLAAGMATIAAGMLWPRRTPKDDLLGPALICLGYCLFTALIIGLVV